jgi:hypothetical protein
MPDRFWWEMSRYVIDIISKILILIFVIIIGVNGFMEWKWYKEIINYKCYHENMEIVENIVLPYKDMHWEVFENSLVCLCLVVVMMIIDGFHFRYVYNYELKYYLVNSSSH